MGILNKRKGADKDAAPDIQKNAEDELDVSTIKVPVIPGTEKRVTLRALEKTAFGHQAGEEFSVAEANAERIIKTGKYEKV